MATDPHAGQGRSRADIARGPRPSALRALAAWRASAIPAPRPSNSCLRHRICAPPIRASPPRSITAISASRAAWSELNSQSPFEIAPPSEGWARELHGFAWLRHLRAAGSELSREQAKALLGDWVRLHNDSARARLAAGGGGAEDHLLAVQLRGRSRCRQPELLRALPPFADRAAPLSLGELP